MYFDTLPPSQDLLEAPSRLSARLGRRPSGSSRARSARRKNLVGNTFWVGCDTCVSQRVTTCPPPCFARGNEILLLRELVLMKTSLRVLRSQFRPSLSFPPGPPLRRGGVFLRRLLRRAGGADKTCGPGRRKLLHPTFCGCAAIMLLAYGQAESV